MRERGITSIPGDGLLAATVPAALDAWCLLLERFGTLRLADVLAPARGLAARGFPMYPFLQLILRFCEPHFRERWPASAALYTPVREIGEPQTNPALAGFFDALIRAEQSAAGSRETRIRAARDSFYRGRAAELIERFAGQPVRDGTGRAHAGLLTAQDLADYAGSIEEPVACDHRGARVWKCPPWSQGPVFLQQLRLLEGFDLAAMGAGSADALHAWAECAKLAFADREACYADPRFEKVPLERLLSDSYTEARRALVAADAASLELRPGIGALPDGWPLVAPAASAEPPAEPQGLAAAMGRRDTTQLVAADVRGNLVCATPSGGWIPTSPVIPELGFPLGTRAQMFVLDPQHPNALAPGKRPRTTLSPSLALLADGRRLGFGTPGGDQQDQWALHFFLALAVFGASDLQAAIDAPLLYSAHAPSSFHPRLAHPGLLVAEERHDAAALAELERRGHRIERSGPWDQGRVLAVSHAGGRFEAAASPRFQVAYAAALP
jgi:gamma-glutamyltranspeptidase/glutathione hydrolase